MKKRRLRSGFTKVELLVIIVVTAILAAMLLPSMLANGGKSNRIRCVNNLKNIGLAFRIFATDNGDLFPQALMLRNNIHPSAVDILAIYLSLTNGLSTPRLLHCPDDKKRASADSYDNVTDENLSYFVSLNASETRPDALLAGDRNLQTNGVPARRGLLVLTTNSQLSWSDEIHRGQGNVAMGDGSVQMFDPKRLRQLPAGPHAMTNYLVIP